jgi:poly(3-hydroxybutyrate) depolymerase
VRGTTRNYAVHAPPSYTGCEPTPLLVFFHGTDTGNVGDPRGNEEQYMLFTGLADHGDERGYLVAFPTAQAFSGTSGTALVWALPFLFPDDAVEADDAFTTALVDELERDYQVDAARVYIAGFSQGGFYVSHLFPNHSTEYAAFGMHGAVCSSTYECPGRPSRRIPGFVRIGSADEVVSEADANQFHEQLLGAGWRDGEDLDFEVVGGMGHTYNAGFNAAQWDFFSRFSL